MSAAPDPFNLARFASAQEKVYPTVLAELHSGEKRSHWMWYIFPQIAGLGRSPTAQYYAIRSRAEADHYLAHPILGPRLRECTAAVLAIQGRSVWEIFGSPDDLKLKSCMTLFAAVAGSDPIFAQVLERYFQGEPDHNTLRRLTA
ncbi:MAG: DUF1810 domain-containing protein [Caldilineaceae bacterium]